MNYYHRYYAGKRYKEEAGRCIKRMAKESTATRKQIDYYNDLKEFIKSKRNNLPPFLLRPPRDKTDCSSKIRGMITIIEKNGWANEFFCEHCGERMDGDGDV